MSAVRWRWRGFGVSLELPERVSERWRSLRSRAARGRARANGSSHLVVESPPDLHLDHHDASEAVAFFEILEQGGGQPATAAVELDGDGAALAHEVARRVWYHTIELPHGVVTPGIYDHRELVPVYGLPDDLREQRALDIGPADGFWSFELERRGATVTAVDVAGANDVDLPGAAGRIARERFGGWKPGDGFALARRALGSRIDVVAARVYDLDPDVHGRFDLVHMGDLLLHLRDPVLALQRVRAVTRGHALLSDCFDPTLDDGGARLTRYLGGWDWATWSIPSLTTLAQMVADAGFRTVEPLITYRLDQTDGGTGYWRVVLRAMP